MIRLLMNGVETWLRVMECGADCLWVVVVVVRLEVELIGGYFVLLAVELLLRMRSHSTCLIPYCDSPAPHPQNADTA